MEHELEEKEIDKLNKNYLNTLIYINMINDKYYSI